MKHNGLYWMISRVYSRILPCRGERDETRCIFQFKCKHFPSLFSSGSLREFILFFLLSLSFLTCALPTPAPQTNALAARGTGADVLKICADLEVDVRAKVDTIGKTLRLFCYNSY